MNKIVLIDICWFESRYVKRAFSGLHGCKVELFSLEHLLQSELHKIQIDFEFFCHHAKKCNHTVELSLWKCTLHDDDVAFMLCNFNIYAITLHVTFKNIFQ